MKETILLVDDEQGIRTVMGLSLRDAGYNVITVASGEEALQLFAERPIPIVITDIRMPGMNGLDLLKHIKILAPETEVILISGHADLEMAIQGLKLEASDFITKPIDDDLLHISLKRALERIAMRNKLKEYTSNLEKMINEKSAQLVEAERQLAARQVVDGFAFGLHTLGSSMSGEQQAFNELPCFIAMHDRFMEVLAVNDLYRERLGNLVGHPSWEPYVLHSNEAMFPVERAIVEGRGARSEQILRDKNGKEIPVLVHTAPILNNEGEVELVLELSVDEQESRRLREELRVTRERFRQLFEESPCYVSVVGRDLQVLEANRAFRHTFGMQSGKRCYELFAGSSAPCDECPVQRSFQDGKPCHTEKWSSTTKAVRSTCSSGPRLCATLRATSPNASKWPRTLRNCASCRIGSPPSACSWAPPPTASRVCSPRWTAASTASAPASTRATRPGPVIPSRTCASLWPACARWCSTSCISPRNASSTGTFWSRRSSCVPLFPRSRTRPPKRASP